MSLQIAINGACGRMGLAVGRLAIADPTFSVVEPLEARDFPGLDRDYGEFLGRTPTGVRVTTGWGGRAEVLIDFSSPDAALDRLAECARRKIPAVICTTGFTEAQKGRIAETAETLPIVFSSNMSVGVNVLFRIAAEVAKLLGPEYDLDIVETHHRFKKDAPSGTAKTLAEEIRRATGRAANISSVRSGDVVGEHRVLFGSLGDSIEIIHRASSRDIFAKGALRAALWVAKAKPGLYSMRDVMGEA